MATESSAALDLGHAVALLAAAVIVVPLFRKLGLGAVLGYLCAGLLIGPFGLGLFRDPQAILHVAELGVVLFLFLIGLEMRPGKLWALRREIFGLGVAQVLACGALLSAVGLAFGWSPAVAVIGAMGFVLSSTAVLNTKLRWPDEFARHKLGDLVGDLALVGARLHARIVAERPSHRGNLACARAFARAARIVEV